MRLAQLAEFVQPKVTNDIIAGGAVAVTWTSAIHEWLSIIVTVMAGIYYLWGFYLFMRKKHRRRRGRFYIMHKNQKRGHETDAE